MYQDTSVAHGVYLSEKLDGMRAFWDGGVSRGNPLCPYSNDKITPTGLWSRYGKVIKAPDWWLDKLPRIPLDGELWMGRGTFQQVVSVVKGGGDWTPVQFKVFDSPPPVEFLSPGRINNPHDKRNIHESYLRWYMANQNLETFTKGNTPFQDVYSDLPLRHEQKVVYKLPETFEPGSEGYMIRNIFSPWQAKRVHSLLKVKPFLTGTAVVVGFTAGKGKHEGRIGSLRVKWGDVLFDLSGFTDEQRNIYRHSFTPGSYHPGVCPYSTVSFAYRELSDSGIPKEARCVAAFR